MDNGMPYLTLNAWCREHYGEKLYKIALDAGFTCPNRDGTLGSRGCIFFSQGGSGDFAARRDQSLEAQIEEGKRLLKNKHTGNSYIAYFQAYTNTYAPLPKLRQIYMPAALHPEVAAISIATRPDCISTPVADFLRELSGIKPVWVELGLQTIHESTASYIRRGYSFSCFETALKELHRRQIPVIVHTILGLPFETEEMVLETMCCLNQYPISGIKLQLLHVLKHTDLAKDYLDGKFQVLSRDAYLSLVIRCLAQLRPDLVIHRLTGDGPKELLIAPLWSQAKRSVLNDLHHRLKEEQIWQGKDYSDNP